MISLFTLSHFNYNSSYFLKSLQTTIPGIEGQHMQLEAE
jgi:hypothetical protein